MVTVGFAGIGTMGFGMSRNLVKAGFQVFVYNRTRQKAEAISGATVVGTPAELCDKAEIIFTCVTNDDALRNILFSKDGIMDNLSSNNVLVDSSTTSVSLTDEIAGKCGQKNAEFLDAPVTGSKKGADSGTLVFMYGGRKQIFENYRNVFEAMGKIFVHCGENTYGQRMKIALNITQSMVLESYLEGVVFALKNGVPLSAITEVLNNSGAKSNVADSKMPSIIKHDFTPVFFLELMNKDMGLANQELEKLGLNLPLANAVINVFREAMAKGMAKEDFTAIAKLLEQKAGVRIG